MIDIFSSVTPSKPNLLWKQLDDYMKRKKQG